MPGLAPRISPFPTLHESGYSRLSDITYNSLSTYILGALTVAEQRKVGLLSGEYSGSAAGVCFVRRAAGTSHYRAVQEVDATVCLPGPTLNVHCFTC